MAKRKRTKKSTGKKLLHWTLRALLWVLKLPYTIFKVLKKGSHKAKEKQQKAKVAKHRKEMVASYAPFPVLERIAGDYETFEKRLLESESMIGIILGARGSGKSALGIKILENAYAKTKRRCYALGFEEREMPTWVSVVSEISQIKNNAHVLVDEGGILFSSRKSMSKANQLVSDLILIARHKSLSIHFISQNSSNLDVNILRQADYLALKPSSLLQKDFERKKVRELYEQLEKKFTAHEGDKGMLYIHANAFQGFVSNPLPSFWSMALSKAFKERDTEENTSKKSKKDL